MNVEVKPYFALGERYPALIGVRAEGDEYEMAYVSKGELADVQAENAKLRELVLDMWANQEALPYGLHIEIRDRMRKLGVEVDG